MTQTKSPEIDAYIARFPAEVQSILEKVRETIRAAAPDANEVISYAMPAFKQKGVLVYFAAWKHHIGFYPPISGDEALQQEAAIYEGEKGNLQFPLDQPMPYELITRIVKHQVQQDLARASKGTKSKMEAKSESGFLALLSSPARNALQHAGITTLSELSKHSEGEILALHGMGPKSIPTLRQALQEAGLAFAETRKKQPSK